jgi:hypothetical protein
MISSIAINYCLSSFKQIILFYPIIINLPVILYFIFFEVIFFLIKLVFMYIPFILF